MKIIMKRYFEITMFPLIIVENNPLNLHEEVEVEGKMSA
jgi:hypothetical protein